MRLIVTGATGFIGGYVVSEFSQDNEVIALSRDIASTIHKDRIKQIEQDLTLPLNRSKLPDRTDAVVHFAQSRFYRQFPEKAEDIFAVNVLSTMRLLEYARLTGSDCFVLASTGGIYGSGPGSFSESEQPRPEGFYAKSKLVAEMLAHSYQQFFRVVVLRFFFVYGRNDGRGNPAGCPG